MSVHRHANSKEQRGAAEVRRRVGVVPARALDELERLFSSLGEVFPVVFEGRDPRALGDLDGLLVLGPLEADELPAEVRVLVVAEPSETSAVGELVEFSADARVPGPLRSRRLREDVADGRPSAPFISGDSVLARVDTRPVWWSRAASQSFSVFSLQELRCGETLRSQLRSGRFMGLVPLLHFLGEVCEELNWSEQPLRASFVIDDPNLHWPSYGFLKYADMVRHASAHHYHVGLAMVPLDGWMVDRRAAALVRANGASLSVLVHGNDHIARELARLSTDGDAELAIGQALRRVAAFERRSGVAVRRVMVPPHGACSEAALRAMFRLGLEAACISRPYPWRDDLPPPSTSVGWYPAEMVAGGLPILPRYHIAHPREELVFRALLRQPLILYGHHWDLAQGLDVLADAVKDVNGVGDVRWGPLDSIARHNYWTRREGDVLGVRMFSRRVLVEAPEGVTALRVHTNEVHGGPAWQHVICATGRARMWHGEAGWTSDLIEIRPHAKIELSLAPEHPLEPDALADLATKPWPIARRVLVEGRDRARALLSR